MSGCAIRGGIQQWQPAIYSKACEHAIVALVHLARQDVGTRASAKDIARKENIPPSALAKVIRELSSKGFIQCFDGPRGGSALLLDPANIRVLDVVTAFHGAGCHQDCAMGYAACSADQPCAMHDGWIAVRAQILEYLQTTIADLAKR